MVHLTHIAYGIACGMVSGGIAITSKLMTPGIPPLVKVFLRFFIGGMCLLPFLSRAEFKKVTKRHLILFGIMGLIFVGIFNYLFFSALKYIDPMTSSLILSIQPIMTLIASALLFGHVPQRRALVGFLIAFSGVALVITKGQISGDMLCGSIGEFLMLAAVISQVAYTLILRTMGSYFSAPFIAFSVSMSGLLWVLLFVLNRTCIEAVASFSLTDWLCMSYIGSAGTALGVVLFSLSVKHLGPALGSLIVFSTLPVATMLYSCVIGDAPTMIEILGGFCVLIGLVFGLGKKKKLPSATLVE